MKPKELADLFDFLYRKNIFSILIAGPDLFGQPVTQDILIQRTLDILKEQNYVEQN